MVTRSASKRKTHDATPVSSRSGTKRVRTSKSSKRRPNSVKAEVTFTEPPVVVPPRVPTVEERRACMVTSLRERYFLDEDHKKRYDNFASSTGTKSKRAETIRSELLNVGIDQQDVMELIVSFDMPDTVVCALRNNGLLMTVMRPSIETGETSDTIIVQPPSMSTAVQFVALLEHDSKRYIACASRDGVVAMFEHDTLDIMCRFWYSPQMTGEWSPTFWDMIALPPEQDSMILATPTTTDLYYPSYNGPRVALVHRGTRVLIRNLDPTYGKSLSVLPFKDGTLLLPRSASDKLVTRLCVANGLLFVCMNFGLSYIDTKTLAPGKFIKIRKNSIPTSVCHVRDSIYVYGSTMSDMYTIDLEKMCHMRIISLPGSVVTTNPQSLPELVMASFLMMNGKKLVAAHKCNISIIDTDMLCTRVECYLTNGGLPVQEDDFYVNSASVTLHSTALRHIRGIMKLSERYVGIIKTDTLTHRQCCYSVLDVETLKVVFKSDSNPDANTSVQVIQCLYAKPVIPAGYA
jgi:hypothetical protein